MKRKPRLEPSPGQFGRRAFLRGTTLVLAGATAAETIAAPRRAFADAEPERQCFAVVTDMHYADKPTHGSRHYRQSIEKLARAADEFQKAKPDFVIELGDFIDAADSVQTELRYLKRINRDFSLISPQRHYVLGNHCVDTLRKSEFLDEVQQQRSFYSFDVAGTHFIVLDACFKSDGTPYERKNFKWTDSNVPPHELEWLRADLDANAKPTIVFAHQRLDVAGNHGVKNATEVRQALEQSGHVRAVFQGHSHQNDLHEIGGIHYCTFVAMVEGDGMNNNGYSLVSLSPNGTIEVDGFVRQTSYAWTPDTPTLNGKQIDAP
ncbi:MAG: metallophosphoesterase family protein [Rubripirellula sp.]